MFDKNQTKITINNKANFILNNTYSKKLNLSSKISAIFKNFWQIQLYVYSKFILLQDYSLQLKK